MSQGRAGQIYRLIGDYLLLYGNWDPARMYPYEVETKVGTLRIRIEGDHILGQFFEGARARAFLRAGRAHYLNVCAIALPEGWTMTFGDSWPPERVLEDFSEWLSPLLDHEGLVQASALTRSIYYHATERRKHEGK